MMPLKIYGVLRSRASRNVWLAKELGLPYELIPVIQAHRLADPSSAEAPLNTSSPAFHAINPNGLIPCVEDDGLVLNESLTVNLCLAKKYAGPLAPGNLREDGSMMRWSLWAATECEPHTIQIIYHRVDRPEHERDPAIVDTAIAALKRPFGVLDEALRVGGGYLVGQRFTVADLNVAEVLRYAQPAPETFAEHPHVQAWIERCQARPAFQEMMRERSHEPA